MCQIGVKMRLSYVDNTGISFTVDDWNRLKDEGAVYQGNLAIYLKDGVLSVRIGIDRPVKIWRVRVEKRYG